MGWASGSEIAVEVVKAVKREIRDPKSRLRIYKPFYAAMCNHDWDTQGEAAGIDPVFDKLIGFEPGQDE